MAFQIKTAFFFAFAITTLPLNSQRLFQWARDQFEGLFKQTPENVNLFLR